MGKKKIVQKSGDASAENAGEVAAKGTGGKKSKAVGRCRIYIAASYNNTIVTATDLEAQRRHRKEWMTFRNQLQFFKTYAIDPIWARLDKAMVRWGL